jgi:hypothetical protein
MDVGIVRQIHDAAIALGAECDPSCGFFGAPNGPMKSATVDRARALLFLHELGRQLE